MSINPSVILSSIKNFNILGQYIMLLHLHFLISKHLIPPDMVALGEREVPQKLEGKLKTDVC